MGYYLNQCSRPQWETNAGRDYFFWGADVSDRVVVFLDWQNVYMGARESFRRPQAPSWHGQVDPVALARHLADDSPFDRELTQVRIYRGIPDPSFDSKGYSACRRQVDSWERSELVHTTLRTLRYPRGWPLRHREGERPQERASAAWAAHRRGNSRLSITGRKLYCHWAGREVYEQVADPTKYTIDAGRSASVIRR
jgi:hypothetical protein